MLKQILASSSGLSHLVDVLQQLEPPDENKQKVVSEDDWVLSKEEFAEASSILVDRFRKDSKTSSLSKVPALGMVLLRWKDWGGSKAEIGESPLRQPIDGLQRLYCIFTA